MRWNLRQQGLSRLAHDRRFHDQIGQQLAGDLANLLGGDPALNQESAGGVNVERALTERVEQGGVGSALGAPKLPDYKPRDGR